PTRDEPVTTPLPMGTMTNHTYISIVSGQGTAIFCFVDYTGIMFSNEVASQGMDAELNAFLQRTKATLISKKPIMYQGMPGLEFEVTPAETFGAQAHRGYGKMFLTSSRLYFLTIIANDDSELLSGKDKFLTPTFSPEFARA